MDFRIILRENLNISTQSTTIYQEDNSIDYTVTFVVGSCVLVVFLLLGIVASAYLCLTLKKGTFLWVSDSSRQLNGKDKTDEIAMNDKDGGNRAGSKDKSDIHETTQV
ncbi:hypothetical protein ABEB36_008273 [Hypothenemus hampei]|uniref:Uncharacterized protein n=1 Tax=Hypothenemus hampei TaxID=57062 RepID=A0ABD1ELF2_HYPHA